MLELLVFEGYEIRKPKHLSLHTSRIDDILNIRN